MTASWQGCRTSDWVSDETCKKELPLLAPGVASVTLATDWLPGDISPADMSPCSVWIVDAESLDVSLAVAPLAVGIDASPAGVAVVSRRSESLCPELPKNDKFCHWCRQCWRCSVRSLYYASLVIHGPRLSNSIPATIRNIPECSVLARIWIFFKKRSYLNFLGSYLQKRAVILPRQKIGECISNARIICLNMSQSFSK